VDRNSIGGGIRRRPCDHHARLHGSKSFVSPFEAGTEVWSSKDLMQRVARAGGAFCELHNNFLCGISFPPAGTSVWSMMWDELLAASLVDPSVITKSETMYLDADISHGPSYGHTVVWKEPGRPSTGFFFPIAGRGGPDRGKWMGHLTPPAQLHPATVSVGSG
jgi:inosine-uridine nucleoside N-ribohydrolase